MLGLLIAIIAALAAALFFFGADEDAMAHVPAAATAIAVVGALLVLYLVTLRGEGHERTGRRGRWIGALLLLAAFGWAAYVYAPAAVTLPQVLGEVTSVSEQASGNSAPAAVRIRRADDGRILAKSRINGTPVDMIVDSGASAIVLKASDAERAGIAIGAAQYDTPLATAGGETYVAPVRVRTLEVGPIRVDDVEAFVAKPGSVNESLLGMSFLRRLSSYELSGEFATLRQ